MKILRSCVWWGFFFKSDIFLDPPLSGRSFCVAVILQWVDKVHVTVQCVLTMVYVFTFRLGTLRTQISIEVVQYKSATDLTRQPCLTYIAQKART